MTLPDPEFAAGNALHHLTAAQRRVLWQLAQHKYGWGYINGVGLRSAARALERRRLVDVDHEFRVTLTNDGDREACRRWPVSPLAAHSYELPEGSSNWTTLTQDGAA